MGLRGASRDLGRIIWQGRVAELADGGNPYVDQFIHGRAEGPIKLDVRAA